MKISVVLMCVLLSGCASMGKPPCSGVYGDQYNRCMAKRKENSKAMSTLFKALLVGAVIKDSDSYKKQKEKDKALTKIYKKIGKDAEGNE